MRLPPSGGSTIRRRLKPFFSPPFLIVKAHVRQGFESTARQKRHLADTPPYRSEPVSEGLR